MKKNTSIIKWFVAEYLGTLLLAATVGIAVVASNNVPSYTALYLPFAVAIVIIVLVSTLGHVSGAHFNPAVTVALYAYRKISSRQLVIYLVAQVLGAFSGLSLTKYLVNSVPVLPSNVTFPSAVAETIGAAILVFAVTTTIVNKLNAQAAGIVIGLSLAAGLTLASATSGGILNPAIALAVGSHHAAYIIAPLIGGSRFGNLVW